MSIHRWSSVLVCATCLMGGVAVSAEGRAAAPKAGAVDADMTAECKGSQLTMSLAGRQVGSARDSACDSPD